MRLSNERLIAAEKIGYAQGHMTVTHLQCKRYIKFLQNAYRVHSKWLPWPSRVNS